MSRLIDKCIKRKKVKRNKNGQIYRLIYKKIVRLIDGDINRWIVDQVSFGITIQLISIKG